MAKMKKKSLKQFKSQKFAEYKKFLKEDEDWDWVYILRTLRYKLQRTRRCISANNIVVSAPQIARQIKEVETLLERVEKDNYYWEISKAFRKKYGSLKIISDKPNPGQNFSRVTFKYTKETPLNAKKIRQEQRRLWLQAEKIQRQDLRKAFDLMYKNIFHCRQLKNYDEAQELFKMASGYFENTNPQMEMVNYLRWGDVFRFEKRFDEAWDLLKKTEQILLTHQFMDYEDFYFQHLGKLFFDQGEYKSLKLSIKN